MTHKSALIALQAHGIPTPYTPTAFDREGVPDITSTFYWAFGVKERYVLQELIDWLGY